MDIEIEYVKSPKWDNIEHTMLTAIVKFSHLDEEAEFTVIPDDVEEYSKIIWNECLKGTYGEIEEYIEPEISLEEIISMYETAVDIWMNKKVQERGYNNVVSCISYENDDNPKFAAEASAVKLWRSRVYTRCYELLNAYVNGEYAEGDIPSVEVFLTMLPQLEW